jgi:hypothetical protein
MTANLQEMQSVLQQLVRDLPGALPDLQRVKTHGIGSRSLDSTWKLQDPQQANQQKKPREKGGQNLKAQHIKFLFKRIK